MKTKRATLLIFFSITLLTACEGNSELKEFGYVFHESTGQNQYVNVEGHKLSIKNFVSDGPNQVPLKSLQALKWNVLYPNSEGNRIFLRGRYDHQSQSLHLSYWYIKVPFEALVLEDETRVPHDIHKVTRQSLERSDFEIRNGFNPNDPGFDPRLFQRAQ